MPDSPFDKAQGERIYRAPLMLSGAQRSKSTAFRWQIALRVVPPIVQARVVVAVMVLVGLLFGLAYLLRGAGLYGVAGLAALFCLGMYGGWCLSPDWQWGTRHLLAKDLPDFSRQRVRLSFDDGPTPGLTDAILDLLAEQGVRASFFVLLPKAKAQPELLRRIVAEGHLLGLHGEDHRAPFFRSAADLGSSLARARAELQALAGQPVTSYRPSHGWKNLALLRAVKQAGLRLSFWDYGVWDTDAPPVQALLCRLRAVCGATAKRRPGEQSPVVLLHDGRGDPTGLPVHTGPLLSALAAWLPSVVVEEKPESLLG
jgi:peptidoglycan/xylan/chitin deacetylase (PgdA/CDA1 family)